MKTVFLRTLLFLTILHSVSAMAMKPADDRGGGAAAGTRIRLETELREKTAQLSTGWLSMHKLTPYESTEFGRPTLYRCSCGATNCPDGKRSDQMRAEVKRLEQQLNSLR